MAALDSIVADGNPLTYPFPDQASLRDIKKYLKITPGRKIMSSSELLDLSVFISYNSKSISTKIPKPISLVNFYECIKNCIGMKSSAFITISMLGFNGQYREVKQDRDVPTSDCELKVFSELPLPDSKTCRTFPN